LVRIVDGSHEIVRVRLADAASQPVTATPRVEETWPYWSEPAQRLVYQASTDGRSHDLLLWDPLRGGTSAIARSRQRDEQWPVWSPRLPQLVFAFRGGTPPAGLVLADVASRSQRLIAATGADDFFLRPSFAPDGASLVAQRRGAGPRVSQLWTLALDGAPQPLTSDPEFSDMKPAFTRDGREIFFSRRAAAGGPSDVFAIAASGGEPRALASEPGSNDHSARPSPVRDEFVFVSDRGGAPGLYLAPSAGGKARALSRDSAREFYAPHWSADGERVLAIATPVHVGRPQLSRPASLAETHAVVFDREGRVLFDAPGFMPDWMPPWREP
jgi:Tol biopolymer transport system component